MDNDSGNTDMDYGFIQQVSFVQSKKLQQFYVQHAQTMVRGGLV